MKESDAVLDEWLKLLDELYKRLLKDPFNGRSRIEQESIFDIIELAGFLPHFTMPFGDIFENKESIESIKNLINEYYREELIEVQESIMENYDTLNVNTEYRVIMKESLELHQFGYFRAVCGLIFPAIERAMRELPFIGHFKAKPVRSFQAEISRTFPWKLQVLETNPRLVSIFMNHIYRKISCSDDIVYFTDNSIPNRHACIHRIIVYDKFYHSLNTIFIADCVFNMIELIRDNPKN
jgi:hypothetical protein